MTAVSYKNPVFYSQKNMTYYTTFSEPTYSWPVGTTLSKITAHDPNNQYHQLPWDTDPTFWIETLPLCIDVYATNEEDIEYKMTYLLSIGCNNVHISSTFTIKHQPIITHTKCMENRRLLSPFHEGFNTLSYQVIYHIKSLENQYDIGSIIPATSYELEHHFDAMYGFSGISRLIKYDYKLKDWIVYNPNDFSLENPLLILTWDRIVVEISNDGTFNAFGIFYDSDTRHTLFSK